jgi:hypothetical protein
MGDLSVSFSAWMYHASEEVVTTTNRKVSRILTSAFKAVCQEKPYFAEQSGLVGKAFLLSTSSGGFSCQFGVMGDERRFESLLPFGYKANSHNLDSLRDQIVLLAGFAKLCECYRTSVKEKKK